MDCSAFVKRTINIGVLNLVFGDLLETLEMTFSVEAFSGLLFKPIIYSFNTYLGIYEMPGIVPGGRDTMVNKTHAAFGIRGLAT